MEKQGSSWTEVREAEEGSFQKGVSDQPIHVALNGWGRPRYLGPASSQWSFEEPELKCIFLFLFNLFLFFSDLFVYFVI